MIKYGIFFHIAARRALLIQNCGTRRYFPSKCGPAIDLSLKPLLYGLLGQLFVIELMKFILLYEILVEECK